MLIRAWCVLMLAFALWILAFTYERPNGVYIDCSLASFHPDYTNEQRELCRKLRQKQSEPREKS
jgi:hypothetical protein